MSKSVSLGPFESLLRPEEQDLEDAHFKEILYNLSRYETFAQRRLLKMKHEYTLLSPFHQSLLPHYLRKLAAMEQAVAHNQRFLKEIICLHDDDFEAASASASETNMSTPLDNGSEWTAHASVSYVLAWMLLVKAHRMCFCLEPCSSISSACY